MKLSPLFICAICIMLINCNKAEDFRPKLSDDSCNSFVPFYEQQDFRASTLSLYCDCLDSTVNFNSQLSAYTEVIDIDFNCNAAYFSQIPTMISVKSLTSNVTTKHITSAFPHLEVYKNKSYTNEPIARELIFLSNMREVALLNAVNFPDILAN